MIYSLMVRRRRGAHFVPNIAIHTSQDCRLCKRIVQSIWKGSHNDCSIMHSIALFSCYRRFAMLVFFLVNNTSIRQMCELMSFSVVIWVTASHMATMEMIFGIKLKTVIVNLLPMPKWATQQSNKVVWIPHQNSLRTIAPKRKFNGNGMKTINWYKKNRIGHVNTPNNKHTRYWSIAKWK